jgi:Tol biopolymer transport system component
LTSHLRTITVNEEGISYHPLPFLKIIRRSIRWEEIRIITTNKISATVTLSTLPHKPFIIFSRNHFRKTIVFSRDYVNFQNLLNIVIFKSSQAWINPEVNKLLRPANIEEVNQTSRKYSLFFILISLSSAIVFLEISRFNISYLLMILIVLIECIAIVGLLCTNFLYKWYGDKWLFIQDLVPIPCHAMILFLPIIFLSGNFLIVLWGIIIITAISLLMSIFSFIPQASGKVLLYSAIAVIFMTLAAGNTFLPKIQILSLIRNFSVFTVSWFPDGSKIFFAGNIDKKIKINEIKEENPEIEGYKSFILDSKTGKILKTLSYGEIFPFSSQWSPNGTKLAFIDFHTHELLMLDAQTLKCKKLLKSKNISLKKYGCWNKNGTKLIVSYSNNNSNQNRIKWTVAIINIITGNLRKVWEGYNAGESFWLPDGTPGSLMIEKKGKKLFRYSIIRLLGHGKIDPIYEATGYCGEETVSPHGKFFIENVQENKTIVINVFSKTQQTAPRKLNIYFPDFSWSPDEKSVITILNGKAYLYNLDRNVFQKITTDMKGNKSFLNWSPDSHWAIISVGVLFPDIFLVSENGKKQINIGRTTGTFDINEASLNENNSKLVLTSMGISIEHNWITTSTIVRIYKIPLHF